MEGEIQPEEINEQPEGLGVRYEYYKNPTPQQDSRIRRIFQETYGRTNSKLISEFAIQLTRGLLSNLETFLIPKSAIIVAKLQDEIIGFCIAHGLFETRQDPQTGMYTSANHEKMAEINYISCDKRLNPYHIASDLIREATRFLVKNGFEKVQIRTCLGWDGDAFQANGYMFVGDQIAQDVVWQYFIRLLKEDAEQRLPLESMVQWLTYYDRTSMPECLEQIFTFQRTNERMERARRERELRIKMQDANLGKEIQTTVAGSDLPG